MTAEESMIDKVLECLNAGDDAEALKRLRKWHGLVCRWVCDDCGATSPRVVQYAGEPIKCNACGEDNVAAKVIQEAF